MIKGLKKYKMRAAAINKSMKKKTEKNLKDSVDDVLEASNEDVPVETGNLRDSGKTDMKVTGSKITGEIEYTADYAIVVHEDLPAQHTRGNAKFLQNAMVKERNNIKRKMSDI